MKQIVIALGLVLLSVPAFAQVANPGQNIAWDYSDASVAAGGVTKFELQVDGGAWVDVGMSLRSPEVYQTAIPALATGSHTAHVRACGEVDDGTGTMVALCSTESLPPFVFVLGVIPTPVDGATLQIVDP